MPNCVPAISRLHGWRRRCCRTSVSNDSGTLPRRTGDNRKKAQKNLAFLAAALRRGARSLHEVLEPAPLPKGTRLLIVVDQFEEIFRYRTQAEDQAAAFVALLLESCRHEDIYIVITMRSDFLGKAAEFQGLPEAINEGLYLTPRLTREQLTDAIGKPARLFGGAVQEELANHLCNEAGNNPDQLPLLQHALMRLWEQDQDKTLTLDRIPPAQRSARGLKWTCRAGLGGTGRRRPADRREPVPRPHRAQP